MVKLTEYNDFYVILFLYDHIVSYAVGLYCRLYHGGVFSNRTHFFSVLIHEHPSGTNAANNKSKCRSMKKISPSRKRPLLELLC